MSVSRGPVLIQRMENQYFGPSSVSNPYTTIETSTFWIIPASITGIITRSRTRSRNRGSSPSFFGWPNAYKTNEQSRFRACECLLSGAPMYVKPRNKEIFKICLMWCAFPAELRKTNEISTFLIYRCSRQRLSTRPQN